MNNKLSSDMACGTDQWDAMTREQRAVAVANDVQALLKAERIEAESGTYLCAEVPATCKGDDDLQELLKAVPNCRVCAIGAMFVAKITARDGATVKSLCDLAGETLYEHRTITQRSREVLTETLEDAFDDDTLGHIESAFEGGWKNKYFDDNERLNAIMHQVIENGGSFTVKDESAFGEWCSSDYDDDYYDDDYEDLYGEDDDWDEDEDEDEVWC